MPRDLKAAFIDRLFREHAAAEAGSIATQRLACANALLAAIARAEIETPKARAAAEKLKAVAADKRREAATAEAVADRALRAAMVTPEDAEVNRLRSELRAMTDDRIPAFMNEMADLSQAVRNEPAPRTSGDRENAVARLNAIGNAIRSAEALIYQPVEDIASALDALRATIPGEAEATVA